MGVRRLGAVIAFAALAATSSGAAWAGGKGLLDRSDDAVGSAGTREFYQASRHGVDPARVPAAVTNAARRAAPGLTVREAFELRHRPMTGLRPVAEYALKGRDARGRAVSVRTLADGGQPVVTRAVPLDEVPAAVLAEGRPYAARHNVGLTGALLVTRSETFLGRTSTHTAYYLTGTRPDRPGAERPVWYSDSGRFRLRDLDDLLWKTELGE